MALNNELIKKLENLTNFLKNKKLIVAFSGGVDSSLLAFLAKKYSIESLSVTIKTVFTTSQETTEAQDFASKYEIPHKIIELEPLENKEIAKNPENRCYICKLTLYDHLTSILKKRGFDTIIDGTNLNDLGDFRPGLKALRELGISTPYIDFKISKDEIRILSKYFGLPTYSKPSMACLASRIPYGQKISKDLIEMVRKAEEFLQSQFDFSQLRVRVHGNNLARIEILKEELEDLMNLDSLKIVSQKLKEIGFTYITLDMEGFRSGSMNELLDSKIKSTLNKH